MAALLKAHNEMKKQVKAGKTNWLDLELSNEEDDGVSNEISSYEEGQEGEAEPNLEVQTDMNPPAPVPIPV